MAPQDKMLKKSDCNLPNPTCWPGKFNKNNKEGTLITKEDWIKSEAKLWINKMKEHEKYDVTYFSVKVVCLLGWLKKGFPKLTTKETRNILYELEEETSNESEKDETPNEDAHQDRIEPMDTETNFINRPGSPDLFDSDDDEQMEEVCDLTRKDKDFSIKQYVDKMSKTLIESEDSMPDFVKNSRIYKKKKNEFIEGYIDQIFEASSSQDVALQLSQFPEFAKNHKYIHEKLSHRSKTELSNWRALKNMKETLKELQNDSSREAFNHRVMLVASVICPRFGVPDIGETKNVIAAAKELKKSFFGGDQSTLKVKERKKKELFPRKVFELAEESWENDSTIPEPAQHVRPQSAVSDGNEKLPARLQVLTNDEAYAQFKENYEAKVKDVMQKHCQEIRSKYVQKPDSCYKDKIFKTLERKENIFPGKTWFLAQKPPHTKMNFDHTTGLCKDCHVADLNYDNLLKFLKKTCQCKTDRCPNYVCTCEDTEDECKCSQECECHDCSSCQVSIFE